MRLSDWLLRVLLCLAPPLAFLGGEMCGHHAGDRALRREQERREELYQFDDFVLALKREEGRDLDRLLMELAEQRDKCRADLVKAAGR